MLRKKQRLPNNNKYDNEGGNTINLLNHTTRPKITETYDNNKVNVC